MKIETREDRQAKNRYEQIEKKNENTERKKKEINKQTDRQT